MYKTVLKLVIYLSQFTLLDISECNLVCMITSSFVLPALSCQNLKCQILTIFVTYDDMWGSGYLAKSHVIDKLYHVQ